MSNKGKGIAVVLLVLLLVISLSLAGYTYTLLQKKQAENLELQDKLEDATGKLKVAEKKVDELKKDVETLDTQLQDSKNEINKINTKLKDEQTARLEALANVDQIKQKLTQQQSIQADLQSKIDQTKSERDKMQAEISRLEAEKADLEIKLKSQQAVQAQPQGVELGKIVVGQEPAPAKTASSSLEGKLLVINKEYNFVVINLGNKDGVEVGDLFSVYRKDKYIGDVRVEKVHESMSAAGFVSASIKNKINEGDKVVRKKK